MATTSTVYSGQTSEPDPFAAIGGGVKLPNGGWVPRNHPAAQAYLTQPTTPTVPPPVGTGGTQATTTTAPANTSTQTQGTTPPKTTTPTIQSQFRDSLLGMLQSSQTPPSLSDPTLAPAYRAYQGAQQRAYETNRAALAERAAATGDLESGGFDLGVRQLGEQRAQDTAGFGAGLLQQESNARRQALLSGLGLAGNLLSDEERLALTRELGLSDLDLRQLLGQGSLANQLYGLQTQAQLGQGELQLRQLLGTGQLGLGLLDLLLSDRYRNTALGAGIGANEYGYNQNALLSLLGL